MVPLLAAGALAGCIPLGASDAELSNTCSSDNDCAAGGGVCANVDGEPTCVATKVDLPGLILEVRPSALASLGGTPASYLVPFGGAGLVAEKAEGLVLEHDIDLPQVELSSIELTIKYDYKSCSLASSDGKIPAEFTFYRHATHAGLPGQISTATLLPGETDRYTATLPAGVYDIHVVPLSAGPGCVPPPPTFYREIDLSKGGTMPLTLDEPARPLSGTISFPKGLGLAGWSVEVVDPKRGLVVSTTDVLEVDPLSLFADYSIEYYWDWSNDNPSPILRLRPPEGTPGLKFFWELAALSPLDLSHANITLVDLNGAVREVRGYVLDKTNLPVAATVAIKSVQLSGNASPNATFGILVNTDKNGEFSTELPPGKYQVTAYPSVDPLKAITKDDELWEIDPMEPGCFCGKSITVGDKSTVESAVMLPNGDPLFNGTATVFPPPEPQQSYLLSRLVANTPLTQVESTPLGPFGQFTLHADPGSLVDLRVHLPKESRFPWLVRSGVKVNADQDGTQGTTLEPLTLSYPVMLQGLVRDPSTNQPLADATVRAWLPVNTTGENTSSAVIQIADGTTGPDGRYTLLVGPSISK